MNKKILIGSVIAGVVVVILALFAIFKTSIMCPYCNHIFTVIEVRKSDKVSLKSEWLGCTNCKTVYGYCYDGHVTKAYIGSGYSASEVKLH